MDLQIIAFNIGSRWLRDLFRVTLLSKLNNECVSELVRKIMSYLYVEMLKNAITLLIRVLIKTYLSDMHSLRVPNLGEAGDANQSKVVHLL